MNTSRITFYDPDDKWGWLANFYTVEFRLGSYTWSSVEHCYQSFKFADDVFYEVKNADTPSRAKKIAHDNRGLWLDEWQNIKFHVMKVCVNCKFSQNDSLADKLAKTSGAKLVEDGPHEFWCNGDDGNGYNAMGRILMDIRSRLKS